MLSPSEISANLFTYVPENKSKCVRIMDYARDIVEERFQQCIPKPRGDFPPPSSAARPIPDTTLHTFSPFKCHFLYQHILQKYDCEVEQIAKQKQGNPRTTLPAGYGSIEVKFQQEGDPRADFINALYSKQWNPIKQPKTPITKYGCHYNRSSLLCVFDSNI
ncbi:hypothetical protein Y032_0387g482 [Ancylostoma ceylanicum]|uniref:Uncharacterized protein n=1 Tax=Ancylostoma ceylanicum TaxID=53326 RepID=A0A016RTM1_9BILA|nr:hypothetical protein Y032_0387g482 [Ancylostoma ceylanicum]